MDSISALRSIPITASKPGQGDGQVFANLATYSRTNGSPVFTHYNVQPVVDVFGGVSGRDLGGVLRDINPLVKPGWQLQPVAPISNYPPVVEDLAFVVAEEVPAAQVLEAIRKGGGSLLTKAELFDIYRGPQIPPGHKSLAYNLTYESTEKPLTEKQIVDIRNRIIRRVEEAVAGKLRE